MMPSPNEALTQRGRAVSPAYTAASRHHHLLTRVAVWMTISSSRRGRAAAAGISRLHGRVPRRLSRLHLLTRVAVWMTISSSRRVSVA